ncbi:hypothetical protein EJ04DRAFT_523909 [Polyplosphaeria fusca]|uniref:Cytidyltransferase-like domain-containing protein n=1 Tax=Polyplosphaeria fusca TaxID=682080 RepID=A0A9P4QZB4_9PLEO|nr:hypothetical protein EJ04DRAFT_523909 [Polyplosphaeria fusca]
MSNSPDPSSFTQKLRRVASSIPFLTPNNLKVAALEPYMKRALVEVTGMQDTSTIFTVHPSFPTPTLRSDKKNRIIAFAGHFNPPHIGHKLLLTHAYLRYPTDNVIAAFIQPLDDDKVFLKLALKYHEIPPLVLTKQQRASLWQDPLLTPWAWANQHLPDALFGSFCQRLLQMAADAGFEMSYTVLVGPDCVPADTRLNWPDGSHELVTGDMARQVDFLSGGREPKKLKGCSQWAVRQWKRNGAGIGVPAYVQLLLLYPMLAAGVLGTGTKKNVERNCIAGLDAIPGIEEKAKRLLKGSLEDSGQSFVCYGEGWKERGTLVYLPIGHAKKYIGSMDISSQIIRDIARNTRGAMLEHAVGALALNPKILAEFLEEG